VASAVYNGIKFVEHPSIGSGIETVVSGVSLIPGWEWAIGVAYFITDLGWQATHDGKSIAQTIDCGRHIYQR
jgi:hypothetical protein